MASLDLFNGTFVTNIKHSMQEMEILLLFVRYLFDCQIWYTLERLNNLKTF